MKVSVLKSSLFAILILLFTFLTGTEAKAFDAVSPTGTIQINNGAVATNSTNLTLNLSATDNSGTVTSVRFKIDGTAWGPWYIYSTTRTQTISSPEGIRMITAQFKDAAGNLSPEVYDTITLDTTLPTGTVLINSGAAATNSTTVTLKLSATDNSGSASQMRFSHDHMIWTSWGPYNTASIWLFAQGEGIKTIYVQFKDAAGNISTAASDTISLDQTKPAGTISINSGAAATNSTAATLNLSATDNSGSVYQVRSSNDSVIWTAWSAYAASKAWTLFAGEGTKTVYVQFKDTAGNVSTVVSDTIRLDQTKPAGYLAINGGAALTNSTAATIGLSSSDNSGTVSEMTFSNDNVTWSAWFPYAATKTWTLTAGDGIRAVYVKFRDAAGNVSIVASDTITLDQTKPVGTVSINGGAAFTNSTHVTLGSSATDNSGTVSQMRFSIDNATWTVWLAYSPTQTWTFVVGDGTKTVYAQFKDAAGNISTTVSDTIRLDTTKPSGTISINGGAASTNSDAVNINFAATDNSGTVYQMSLSNDNINWSPWFAYFPTQEWTLAAGDGMTAVYVKFKDAAGNVSTVASDTITLDQTLPAGTIAINNGTPSGNSSDVNLYLSATDNSGTVSQMRFSNDNVNWSAWSVYATTKWWTLIAGEGIKTVYVQFADDAGNVSVAVSDTITIDQTPPVGTISINSGAASTLNRTVDLTPSATDNSGTVAGMRVSLDNVTWYPWSAYASSKLWSLTAGEGVKTIYVQFMDASGNTSAVTSDTITLDQTAPVGTISIKNGAQSTKITDVTLTLTATDNNVTVSHMRFSTDNVTWSAWENYATAKAWTLSAGEGVKTVYVQFMDAAGNASTAVSDKIALDLTLPTGTISIKNGAVATKITAVTLNLTATDNNVTISKMRFKDDAAVWSAWEDYATTKAWTLVAGEGVKTVYVQFTDAAGNSSTAVSDTIRLDTTIPTGTISINGGAASTYSTNVTLTLSAADNNGIISQMRFKDDTAVWSAWENYAPTKAWTLSSGAGTKTVYVQFTDAAGNPSVSSTDTISLVTVASISGRVTTKNGTGISNVIVSINTVPVPMTATTDANGNYTVSNVPAGSYLLTPGVTGANGSVFSPATRNITLGQNNISGVDFRGKVTYSVSGTVNYTGSKTGRVYVYGFGHGTSISAPGAFTIRGVEPGAVVVVSAYMDHIGDGRARVTNPAGWAHVTVGGSNVSGVSITLTDLPPLVPTQPKILSVSPSNGAAIIEWKCPVDLTPNESADSFNIYYGTSPSVSPVNGTRVGPVSPWGFPNGYLLRGLTNGSTLYFVVVGNAGANTSAPSNVYGPVTIGPRTGGNTVSGTITASGFTPTGSLIVNLSDTAGSRVYSAVINSPAASQPYSITGVPTGSYYLRVLFDMNNNGFFDGGDLTNEAARDDERMVRVSSNQIKNAIINSADIPAMVLTDVYSSIPYRSTFFRVEPSGKLPVKVTILSGPGMAGQSDLEKGQWLDYFYTLTSLDPSVVGDTYTINLTYRDGTTSTITRSVTGFVDNILTALTPSGSVPGSTTPTFTWSASPSVLPSTGVYRIWLRNNSNYDEYWYSSAIPSTAMSAQFNFDGFAVMPSLTPGTVYTWSIEFVDQYGNTSTSNRLSFTP